MKLKILRLETYATAHFEAPAYGLVAGWLELIAAIQGRFAPLGFSAGDIKLEGATGQPNDFHVRLSNSNIGAGASVRLQGLEAWTNDLLLTEGGSLRVAQFMKSAQASVSTVNSEVRISSYSILIRGHVRMIGVNVQSLLDSLTNLPEGARAKGIRLDVAPDVSHDFHALLDFEPSYVLPDSENAFASIRFDFPGQGNFDLVDKLAAGFIKDRIAKHQLEPG